VSNGLSTDASIDEFLDKNNGDKEIEFCAKLAIAVCILEAEKSSPLNYDKEDRRGIASVDLDSTWYNIFWQRLSRGITKEKIVELFNNVTIITFNYDRCIEQFLLGAIQNEYGVEAAIAQKLVYDLNIYHPYGSVGSLVDNPYVHFGQGVNDVFDIREIARQIKTFSERIDDSEKLEAMRQKVMSADTVVFLGFAFHKQNMDLIKPKDVTSVSRVFATAKGVSIEDCKEIGNELRHIFGSQLDFNSIKLDDVTCLDLFNKYRKSISRE
jgi:hypothetical protein